MNRMVKWFTKVMLEGQCKSCRGSSGTELKTLKTTSVMSLRKDFNTVFFALCGTNAERAGLKPAIQLWETRPLTVLASTLGRYSTVPCISCLVIHLPKLKKKWEKVKSKKEDFFKISLLWTQKILEVKLP